MSAATPSRLSAFVALAALTTCPDSPRSLQAVNDAALPTGSSAVATAGALLVDGTGGPPLSDAVVVVQDGIITAVGRRGAVTIPAGAEIVEAAGTTLLPGLIDAHFHLDGDATLPAEVLKKGITSLRDPGAWIHAYDTTRVLAEPLPRLFLTGPHLDGTGPAHPKDALVVTGIGEARDTVRRFAADGASAIKLYYRLPPTEMAAATEEAHALGLPVTTHLEIVDVTEALRMGVDGIEHITSFGAVLAGPNAAEAYRRAVLADNEYRRDGRYAMWAAIDPKDRRRRAWRAQPPTAPATTPPAPLPAQRSSPCCSRPGRTPTSRHGAATARRRSFQRTSARLPTIRLHSWSPRIQRPTGSRSPPPEWRRRPLDSLSAALEPRSEGSSSRAREPTPVGSHRRRTTCRTPREF